MTAYCIDGNPAWGAPGDVHTVKMNDVGVVRHFSDGYYIYLPGVASLARGDWVSYKAGVYVPARLTTDMFGDVAVATAAAGVGTWSWYGYVGSFLARCLSATLSNGYLWATATAGSAEDLIIKSQLIYRATATGVPVTTAGGGLQIVAIDRPYIGSLLDSNAGAGNVAPVASLVSITTDNVTAFGHYTYSDADGDLESASTFRWLHDGVAWPGETGINHTLVAQDLNPHTLTFEVTPRAATGVTPGIAVTADIVIGGD